MFQELKKLFKNTKLKGFLFFLALATVFWILTKFSRQYTATTTAGIEYVNIPEATLISESNLKEISFDLTANGFEFLFFNLKSPTVQVDISKYYTSEETQVIIPKAELIKLISKYLNANIAVRNPSVEALTVKLDAIVSKKVPVIAKTDFSYKDGFKLLDSVVISPDSIVVSGPSKELENVHVVTTKMVSEKNIDKSVVYSVAIENEQSKLVMQPKEVSLSLKIAEFSQKEMVLPITVVNVPEETVIKLIPNVISVSFDVSVEDFRVITENDFELVCDYSERNTEENFMIPRITKSPKGVTNIEYETKKIDFLIFK
ncbi:hypothetical protein [Ulvibacter litoralis]|uniref:YbbR-like protein n=1 Tax=Ulvibacter litoralis TaxID=227084 RepID=A0A1G7EMA5_9FLAO|nr:hypothetical protein [Ulvibacter litoralis]GHC54559.1 hypothetical protein GCM10008083_18510 [Ulvibacter litoralis]SDE64840.1 hypothetical protein SAMN05421855_10248 [Ulvibacter litoralis]